MNNIELTVTLTAKPELKFTQNGLSICNMRAYFSKKTGKKRDDGKDEYKAGWIDVSCFGELADYAGGFEKGDKLDIRGMLDFWEAIDKVTGKPKQHLQVKAFEIAPKTAWTASGQKPVSQIGVQKPQPATPDWANEADLPF